jgi:DNA-binding response OmpR family regulator
MAKPLRVYIVEDSAILQRLLVSAVLAAGAQVIGCSADAQTATSDLFVQQPDLVVIDISLSSGSGFDVLKALHDHNLAPGAIKLVLTNHPEYHDLSLQLGADRFFDKALETSKALAYIGALAAAEPPTRASSQPLGV